MIEYYKWKKFNEVHLIGRLDAKIYSCIKEDIVTDGVIITDKHVQHIIDRHFND